MYEGMKNVLYNFYEKNIHLGRNYVRNHFLKLGVQKRTLNRWLKALEEGETLERKKGSGRKSRFATSLNIKKNKSIFRPSSWAFSKMHC